MTLQYQPGHAPALDGVRGIAVFLVLFFHSAQVPNLPFSLIKSLGWIGVDLFFALSGFLITGILLDQQGQPRQLKNFYIRRVLRIFPIYYLMIGLFLVYYLVVDRPELDYYIRGLPYLLTYTQNLYYTFAGWPAQTAFLNHFWSLAIEEQYYLLWPILVLSVSRNRLLLVCALLLTLAIFLRYQFEHLDPFRYTFTLCRIDGLVFGSIAAILVREYPGVTARFLPLVAVFAVLLFIITVAISDNVFSFTAFGLLFAVIILYCFSDDWIGRALSAFFSFELFRILGKYSYGMYVYHLPIFEIFFTHFQRPPFISLFIMTMIVSVASYHLFEERFLKMKARFS